MLNNSVIQRNYKGLVKLQTSSLISSVNSPSVCVCVCVISWCGGAVSNRKLYLSPLSSLSASLRDRLKKLTAERDSLESQLKNEKDERDLYKVVEGRL